MKFKSKGMITTVEFEGLKLRMADFRFKNRDEMNNFFNKALIDSPLRFINLQNQLFLEQMHVIFSWMRLSRILAFGLFAPAFIGIMMKAPQWFNISMVIISIFFFLRSKYLSYRLNNIVIARSLFNEMAQTDMDSLEYVRQELIDEQKASAA